MKILLEAYENYLIKEKRLSKQSVESYLSDLWSFFVFFEIKTKEDIFKVNKTMIMAYSNSIEKIGKSRATVLRNLSSVRSFYSYLDKKRLIDYNPAENIKISKERKKAVTPLTEEEMEKLINQPDLRTYSGMRDKIMIEILYKVGIEVNELILLNMDDFNYELNYLKCVKGSKSRIIPIENSLRESIFNYIETYKEKFSLEENSALFLNYSGKRISRQGFWKLMKKHSNDADIDADINAYVLKQTFFARLRR